LRRKHQYKPLYLQAHCQSRTSQRYNQSFVKELAKPTQGEFQNIFSSPSKKNKTPDTQTDTTKTLKRNVDNGLQGRWTEGQLITAPTKNWRFSASYDSFVVHQTFVLRMNICGINRQLLVAAKR
jgi:hypothetical protein